MATVKDLRKYLNYAFSTGVYAGKDYLSFQTKYINYLRSFCRENGRELCKVLRSHYNFSCFIKNAQNKYVYLSISDVRVYRNEWFYRILIRRAESDTDYIGGANKYTSLENLQESLKRLFSYA